MTGTPSVQPVRLPRGRPSRLWLWGPVALYMAAIFVVSSIGQLPAPPGGMNDSLAHTIEYSGLAALMLRALAQGKWAGVTRGGLVGAVAFTVLYGLSDEIHQLFVPGRTCEAKDLAADAIGAAGAVGALWLWGIIRRFSGFDDDRI